MPLVTRTAKGSPLTTAEMDGNLTFLNARTRPYTTVAAMKADADLAVGETAQTLGYYAAGDGGGATYQIVAANTGTQDGGSLITLANTRQAQALFPGNVVRLSQFGAKGDYAVVSNVPTSLGGWTDLGGGVYELTVAGYNANPDPLTFTLTTGKTYIFTRTKTVNTSTNTNGYELKLFYDARDGGQWEYHQPYTNATAPINPSALSPPYTPAGSTFELRITPNSNYTVGWSRLSNITLAQATNNLTALNAALAWFSTSKVGTLVLDLPFYVAPASSATVTTIPENVGLVFENRGALAINSPLVINSRVAADNRPIFTRWASVTFGPQQLSVKPNWFGL